MQECVCLECQRHSNREAGLGWRTVGDVEEIGEATAAATGALVWGFLGFSSEPGVFSHRCGLI